MTALEAPDPPVTSPSTQELLTQLAGWMARSAKDKAEIEKIQHEAAKEAAAYVLRLDEAAHEIKLLRFAILDRMEAEGVRTIDSADGSLQCQRPKTTKLTIVDLDRAQAHLADLDRLQEVQRVSIDENAVLYIAKTLPGGIEGVEEVTSYGFKVVNRGAKS